jgi:alkane 1-monooxygenase
MSSSAPALDTAPLAAPSPRQVAGLWARHLTSLTVPGIGVAFVATGPHPWYVAPLFLLPLVLVHDIDCVARWERAQPDSRLPAWPFDALVYLLAGLQLWLVAETVLLFTRQGIFSVDMAMVFVVVGASSGFSIITAHELIHRRRPWERALGRLLLCSVLYEHFFTEHLRGHHVRVATPEDPATARFGEGYEEFFRRTLPAQLRSAWRLEQRRIGNPGLLDPRLLRNRVLHGLVLEWGIAAAVLAVFGLAAFVAFALQALVAVRLLEAVNYFEHWGLRRSGRRVRLVDSWDTHSWFTYYGLIGLSRHADHHAYPARPYQQLRVWDEAPLLPFGYVGMVDLVIGRNDAFQRSAAVELGRRRLGPFADEAGEGTEVGEEAALARLEQVQAARSPGAPSFFRRLAAAIPPPARAALLFAAVVLAVTTGVQWETGGAEMGFAPRLALDTWIAGVFAFSIRARGWLGERVRLEVASWLLAFGLLLALGVLGDLARAALAG